MSEGPGFLSRWARHKAAAQRLDASVPATEPHQKGPEGEGATEPVEDLPPLDTLGMGSDYTGFLRSGVSRAVQNQALAIAWASDPRIASFRGMADYDWDFNAVGYGRLGAQDDVAALLRRIVAPGGEPEAPPPKSAPASPDPSGPTASTEPAVAQAGAAPEAPAVVSVESQGRELDQPQIAAAAASAPDAPVASGRSLPRHGGALPS
jgi:hypothetical protein